MDCPSIERKLMLLDQIRKLPQKILALHEAANLIQFVLHDLSQEGCFNLERTAYVIDNPDFNCIKGIAGVCADEWYHPKQTIWQEEKEFSCYMEAAPFNNKVRSLEKASGLKAGMDDNQIVIQLKEDLDFTNPLYYSWPIKHGNRGILLYQKRKDEKCDCDYLLDCLCMIGFCPVY